MIGGLTSNTVISKTVISNLKNTHPSHTHTHTPSPGGGVWGGPRGFRDQIRFEKANFEKSVFKINDLFHFKLHSGRVGMGRMWLSGRRKWITRVTDIHKGNPNPIPT